MFRGFLIESKAYLNYPKCGRLRFWFNLPRAWVRFQWYGIKAKLK